MSQGAILDGNTFALWRFDEASQGALTTVGFPINDSAGTRHLSFATQVDGVVLRSAMGLVGLGDGRGLIWPNGQSPARVGRATDNGLRAVLQGSYTLEMWVVRTASPDAMNFFTHTIDSAYPKPTTADHDLLIVQGYPDGSFAALYTAPLTGELITVGSSLNAIPLGVRTHIAVRKTVDGGDPTQCTLALFVNGVPDIAYGPGYINVSQAADAGSNGALWIGSTAFDWSWPMQGIIDDIRLSNVARSDAEILETYNRGVAVGGGGGGSGVTGVSATEHAGYLDITLSEDIDPLSSLAADPANWTFSGGTVAVRALLVERIAPTVIRVYHSEPHAGDSLTVHVPYLGIVATNSDVYTSPASFTFTAVAVPPVATLAQPLDSRHVRVIFSESVIPYEALMTGNYSISPPLDVLSVSQETERNYILTTSPQTSGTTYTITVTNVRDNSQNPV